MEAQSEIRMSPLWTLGPESEGKNSWDSVEETVSFSFSSLQIIWDVMHVLNFTRFYQEQKK